MTIKAYTFETAQTSGTQLVPYDAKVDARVRRDMFYGFGNLIVTSNRNGWLNNTPATVNGDTCGVYIPDTVTFLAGGRMFSMSENITLTLESVPNTSDIYISKIGFNINTQDVAGNFVSVMSNPSSPTFSTTSDAWESDQFSVVYSLIVAKTTNGWRVYPHVSHNATVAAGAAVNLNSNGLDMNGSGVGYRGSMLQSVNDEAVHVSQTGNRFTISGRVGSYKKTDSGVVFGLHTTTPYMLDVDDGAVTIMTKGWMAIAKLGNTFNNGMQNSYDFELTNIKTIAGEIPGDETFSGAIFGNFTGQWA